MVLPWSSALDQGLSGIWRLPHRRTGIQKVQALEGLADGPGVTPGCSGKKAAKNDPDFSGEKITRFFTLLPFFSTEDSRSLTDRLLRRLRRVHEGRQLTSLLPRPPWISLVRAWPKSRLRRKVS